jgi:hypothetical protein
LELLVQSPEFKLQSHKKITYIHIIYAYNIPTLAEGVRAGLSEEGTLHCRAGW